MGEIIGTAGLNNSGLMPAGLFYKHLYTIYLEPGGTSDLGDVNGFVGVLDSYSWGGIALYWCSYNYVKRVASIDSSPITVEYKDGKFFLKNNSSNRRGYRYIKQNIPI